MIQTGRRAENPRRQSACRKKENGPHKADRFSNALYDFQPPGPSGADRIGIPVNRAKVIIMTGIRYFHRVMPITSNPGKAYGVLHGLTLAQPYSRARPPVNIAVSE